MSQIAQLGQKRFENSQTVNLQRILQDTIDIEQLVAEKKASELDIDGEGQGEGQGEGEGGGEGQEGGVEKTSKKAGRKKVNGDSVRKKLVS